MKKSSRTGVIISISAINRKNGVFVRGVIEQQEYGKIRFREMPLDAFKKLKLGVYSPVVFELQNTKTLFGLSGSKMEAVSLKLRK